MKKLLIAVLIVLSLALSACSIPWISDSDSKDETSFDENDFLPEGATDEEIRDVDFRGDGIFEKILVYKKNDDGRELQYLDVFEFNNDNWTLVKRDVFAGSQLSYEINDFGNDKTQELFITISGGENKNYSLLVFKNDKYEFLDPSLVTNPSRQEPFVRFAANETEARLDSVTITQDGIREQYGIYCASQISCGTQSFLVKYENGSLKRTVLSS